MSTASAGELAIMEAGNALALSSNPKSRKLRSLVWNDFTKEQLADGNMVAVCNHCKKQLTASSRSGTTHLKNHLIICTSTKRVKRKKLVVRRLHLKPGEAAAAATGAVKGEGGEGGVTFTVDSSQFDQDSSRQDLARMVIMHGYPFNIVEHPGFRSFIRNLQPQFKMVSADTVKADCMQIYDSTRLKLQQSLEKLPSRVSLTVDMWKSMDASEYLSLTCHYVDEEWRLQKKILNFMQIEQPLLAQEISKTILERLQEWSIEKKISSIILDNCVNGHLVAGELHRSLGGSVIFDGILFCAYSCGHVLNRVVLESLPQAQQVVDKVRGTVQYVKSSQERLIRFQKAAKQMVSLHKPFGVDVPGNWSSTYVMLETVCQYQDTFTRLAESDLEFTNLVSPKEWIEIKAITECLDVLYQALEKLTITRIPTANLFFIDVCGIYLLLKTWCRSQHPFAASLAKAMLTKFEQYWNLISMLMAIASILDPRYKMKSVEYFFKQIYDDPYQAKTRIDNAHNSFISIYNQYAVQSASSSTSQAFVGYGGSNAGSGNAGNENGVPPNTFSRITLSDTRRGLDQYLQETSSGLPLRSDLDMYLEEAVHPSKEGFDFDILAWWKYNAAKYPILSLMARDILAIPVSAVPLDSNARSLNQYLSSSDPVTIQCLICTQNWIEHETEGSSANPLAIVPHVAAISDGIVDGSMAPGSGD